MEKKNMSIFLPGVVCPCDDPRYSCILRVYIADALNKLDHCMFKKSPKYLIIFKFINPC